MPAPHPKAHNSASTSTSAPETAASAFEAALAARRAGDWQGSLACLYHAQRLEPNSAAYHAEAGAALFMLQRPADAGHEYEQALAIDPSHLPSLNNLGVILSLAGKFKDAEALLQRSASLNPAQVDVWLNLCSAVEGLDYREDDQVAYARRAVALEPRKPVPYRYLGKALLRRGDPKSALDAFAIARSLAPDSAEIPYSMAICHVELGNTPEAVQHFQLALAIDPAHGQTYYALAEFLYRLDEFAAADEAVREAEHLLDDKISPSRLHAKILFALNRYEEALASHKHARHLEYTLRQSRTGVPVPESKFVLAPVETVEDWCRRNNFPVIPILPECQWTPETPIIFGPQSQLISNEAIRLPHAYAAEIRNAEVIPGHEIILADQDRVILYDRLVQTGDWHWLREDDVLPLIGSDHVVAECPPKAGMDVEAGIFMFSEGWYNYAHWLVEQLPRLYSVERNRDWDGLPLLVNDGLYPQQLESLQLAGGGRYPIRILDRQHRYHVKRLVYPSNLTAYHKRRYRPGESASAADGPFHEEAIQFLRERLLPQCAQDVTTGRRLWLSRKTQKKTGQRRLVNEAEIEALFNDHGFESIAPETLSFRDQVRIFAEAEMIAGPGGAAMMNIIFSPPGARTLVLTKDHPQVNFHYFTNIGQAVGHRVAHVCGEHFQTFGVHGFETDFVVPLPTVQRAIHEFLGL